MRSKLAVAFSIFGLALVLAFLAMSFSFAAHGQQLPIYRSTPPFPSIPDPLITSDDATRSYWQAQRLDFERKMRDYCEAWNAFFDRYSKGLPWDVKKARELVKLSDKVYQHPLFRK